MLVPLGDGDYVYEVSAHWGEVGSASYVFRTLPQLRGAQKEESPDADGNPAQVVDQQPEELSVSKGASQPDEPDNGTTETIRRCVPEQGSLNTTLGGLENGGYYFKN